MFLLPVLPGHESSESVVWEQVPFEVGTHTDTEPTIENYESSGEFFVSPLTDFRYLIESDPEMGITRFCRLSDAVCYLSIPEILEDESKDMPKWMLKVAPSLRERIDKEIANGNGHDSIKLIVQLDEKHFHKVAEHVWNDRSLEFGEVAEEIRNLDAISYPEQNTNMKKELLTRLDSILDDSRKEIYALADERVRLQVTTVSDQIKTLGGDVSSYTPVLPAIFATAPAETIPTMALIQGIERISENSKMEMSMDVSAYAIGADTWWNNGYDGGTWDLAIVDTGIDGSHPALTVDFAQVFHDDGKLDGLYNDNSASTDDLNGHGTHIAGTVASADATYKGVAYGMDALINAKAGWLTTSGWSSMYWSDAMKAVDWAINTAGADVISFSFGGSTGVSDTDFSRFFDAVVDDLGVSVALAAGNYGGPSYRVTEPANAYNGITVGNMNDQGTVNRADDTIYFESSRGPTGDGRIKPDLVAPGSDIMSTNNEWETENDFVPYWGSSMATPHIAASILLLMDYMNPATPFPPIYKALLLNSADNWGAPGPDNTYGWGYVNLDKAYTDRSYVVDEYVDDTTSRYKFYKGPTMFGDKATVVWNRHATYDGSTYPSTYYNLNNLDLFSYDESDNYVVDSSSTIRNNVEQVIADGNYASIVHKVKLQGSLSGVAQEHFALALEGTFSLVPDPGLSFSPSFPLMAELGNTYQIMANISNLGGLNSHNVEATLNLPPGTTLISGDNPQMVGTVNIFAFKEATWQVRFDTMGQKNFRIDLSSNSYGETFTLTGGGFFTTVQDTTAPTSSVDPLSQYTGSVTFPITATATDFNVITDVELFYKKDGVGWTSYGVDNAAPWDWSFDTSTTGGDGFYEFHSIATDNASNVESPPASRDALTTVDTNPPWSSVDPLPIYENTVIFGVTASAGDSSSGVKQVELCYSKDGGPWNSFGVDGFPPWSWNFDSSMTGGDGDYEFYSIATDNASNVEPAPASADATTTVDTTDPSSSVDALPTYESNQEFVVNATASDATSGLSEVDLHYSRDGGPWTSYGIVTIVPWSWDFNSSTTGGDGFYEFYSIATDTAGNVESPPGIPDANTTVDTTPPWSLADPLPAYETSALFTITATAGDLTSDVSQVELCYRMNSGPVVSYGIDASAPWSWDFDSSTTGGDGDYEFYTIATDNAMNVEGPSMMADTFTTVDTVEPTSSVDALPMYESVQSFKVTATASDATSGVNRTELFYSLDGGVWTSYGVDTSYPWSWDLDTSATGGDGFYEFYSVATDNASHTEPVPMSADTNTTVDTEKPTSSVDALPTYLSNESFNVTATATDANGVSRIELWFSLDTGSWTMYSEDTATPWSWDFNTSTTGGDGVYDFYTRAYDTLDNYEDAPPAADENTTVDTVKPSVTITSPPDNEWSASRDANVEWTGSDDRSGIDYYEIQLDNGTWNNTGTTTNYVYSAMDEGSHNATVRAYDRAGNFNESVVTFGVDTEEPEVSIINPPAGFQTISTIVLVEWSGYDPASGIDHYEIKINDDAYMDMGLETGHTFGELSVGDHTFTVKAVDGAGNFREESLVVQIVTELEYPFDVALLWGLVITLVIMSLLTALILMFYVMRRKTEKEEEEPEEEEPEEEEEEPEEEEEED
jgi:serine protease AprX